MATVTLTNLTKRYGKVEVLHGINLQIADGEFVVFVGPSGCGKSTTLRMIAGLEGVTAGRIIIDGRDVTQATPADRDIAMVFQNYALYPHMDVAQNMSFALELARTPKTEIQKRVESAARILNISHLLKRKPKELSGGQRQRVAMGRAIVREPKVFLFDEPLSNLDAKLRVEMRTEIKKLHQNLGASMVYVTHDQIEAMTLATKIVVMKGGVIQQIGTPAEIYNTPANLFVADFMGSPAMNLIPARVRGQQIEITRDNGAPIILPTPSQVTLPAEVILGLRPEDIAERGYRAGSAVHEADCLIDIVEPAGADTFVGLRLGGKEITARLHSETNARPGQVLPLAFDLSKASYFDPATGRRLN